MATVYKITQTVTGNSSSSWAEDGSDPTQPSGIDGSESEFAKDFYSMVIHRPSVGYENFDYPTKKALANGMISSSYRQRQSANVMKIVYNFDTEAKRTAFMNLDWTEYHRLLKFHGWTTERTTSEVEE